LKTTLDKPIFWRLLLQLSQWQFLSVNRRSSQSQRKTILQALPAETRVMSVFFRSS
jgi:hypothetical protein